MNQENNSTISGPRPAKDITDNLYARTGKLPVWRTIVRAWAIVFRRLNIFVALAAIPMALTWLIQFIGADLVESWHLPGRVRIVIEEPFRWVFWTVFSVAWHRYALLGHRDSRRMFQFQLGTREIKFMAYASVLAVPLLLARVPLLYFGDQVPELPLPYLILMLVLVITGITVGIRFSFVFPSVSVERKTGLKQAWGETSGSGWRIFWASFLASIPLGVLDRLARELVLMMEPIVTRTGQSAWENPLGHWMIGLSIAQLILTFFFTAVLVSVLCIAFRRQTEWEPPSESTTEKSGG
ncbi:MAG: hypothetical protein HN725_01490 [Alphaproteobacteria bacterium]|jgi:hypothetical protein|nr:hypothetical protein [Alphaproteobacteria bacterium]MBT4086071.1 hypothetical protein [Alphaproteobacteria bacterium]MBT4543688.1 hypothetical protein [Alphaproteobacteria bacterium]MBT7743933.1 hypothetical protein [Alphaproteobacteria bacterium]